MHYSPADSQSPAFAAMQPQQPRVLGHKRRRSDASSSCTTKIDSTSSSCCTTSGESSGDESDSFELELEVEEEEEAQADAKRRRRAELDGLKKSVRRMEAQVVDASAQLRDLAALVAQVVARRQQQQQQLPSLRQTHSSSTS